MATMDFPASPSTGDIHTHDGKRWQWDGAVWRAYSLAFTGTPVAPTAAADTNTTQIATTAYVQTELGDYLTTSTAGSTYAPLASPALTGNPTAPTQSSSDNSTKIATTAYADAAGGGGGGGTSIADADADTKIQVEESSDEDIIRFDVAGTQVATMTADGLLFGTDTASANAMDDYEEGNWTAAFTCGGGGTIAPNASYDQMNYTKIGRVVHVSGNVDGFTVSSPTGSLTMTGLPFAIDDTAERSDRGCFVFNAHGLVSAEDNLFGEFHAGSGLLLNYGDGTTGGGGAHMATLIDAGTYLRISATYMAAT